MKKTMIRGGIIVLEDTLLTGYDLILEGHQICAITKTEKTKAEDAEILVIAHGIVARSARTAIDELREKGIKAGLFRPITIRPLAVKPLRTAVKRAKQILFTESANGQLAQMVLEQLYGLTTPYSTLYKMGVGVTGDDIVNKVEEIAVKEVI